MNGQVGSVFLENQQARPVARVRVIFNHYCRIDAIEDFIEKNIICSQLSKAV